MTITGASPAIEEIVPPGCEIERIATGFLFTEGPVWTPDGALLFSDIPANRIYRWTEAGGVTVHREKSGWEGDADPPVQLGSNGLTLDREARVCVCEHGNRRVTRIEPDGSLRVLADRWEGRRLNSPNDLAFHSGGTLYFTDPPYGLRGRDQDPAKELAFNGIFSLRDGELRLLHTGLSKPNGLAFSPGEKLLYVANSDPQRRIWMRFGVRPDGALEEGEVFFDATANREPGNPDGLKVDQAGNLYCTGPGGIWIFTPEGRHLGTLQFPEVPANCHWGGEDARTLYVTARTSVYRVRLLVPGIRPAPRI